MTDGPVPGDDSPEGVSPEPHSLRDLVEDLERRRKEALGMGGEVAIRRHHDSGRLTVRERIDRLLDEGSFFEIGLLGLPERRLDRPMAGDGVVTGLGRIGSRKVCVIGIDATVLAGSTAPVSMRKQGNVARFAAEKGLPLVILCDADGGRIPDVMGWRFAGLPFDFSTFLQVPAGHPPIPRVAAVLGPSYGDSSLHAASGDFVVMVESAAIGLSGPTVVESAIGERITDEDLGGPEIAQETGKVHLVVDTEDQALALIGAFLSYLPTNASLPAPVVPASAPLHDPEGLVDLVPTHPRRAYDMYTVIDSIVDGDTLLPLQPEAAKSVITALARLEGHSVGVVASQPRHGAGALDVPALDKVLGFAQMCDTFNIPLLFLQDVPGLLIGREAERQGIVHAYERLVARLASTRVPTIVVVVRKAYGGGHYALGGRPTKPDLLVAWPSAEMGFMAPDTGVRTVNRRRLEEAEREGGSAARMDLETRLTREWMDDSEPWEAAANLYLDDIIHPARTREVVAAAIDYAWGSRNRVA